MKRVFPKKMKPVPSCAAGSDAVAGQVRQAIASPGRARTSAAMIGLAISMGASSLLMPQQSDAAVAADPVAAEPPANVIPTPLELLQNEVPADATSTAGTDLTLDAPGIEPKLQEAATPLSVSQTEQASAAIAPPSGEQDLTIPPETKIARSELQAGETYKTLPESYSVEPILAEPVTSPLNEVQRVGESSSSTDEVHSLLKVEQDVALDNLKEKRDRLRNTLAELGYEESVSSSDKDYTQPVEQSTAANNGEPVTESPAAAVVLDPIAAPLIPGSDRVNLPIAPAQNPVLVPSQKGAIAPGLGQGLMNAAPDSAMPRPNPSQREGKAPTSYATPPLGGSATLPSVLGVTGVAPGVVPVQDKVSSPSFQVSPVNSLQQPKLTNVPEGPSVLPSGEAASTGLEGSVIDSASGAQDSVGEFTPGRVNTDPEKVGVVTPDLSNAVIIEPEETPSAASKFYQVNPGDTLDAIARHNGISKTELIRANQISDPDFIKVQQKIKIPLISAARSAVKNAGGTLDSNPLNSASLPTGDSAVLPKAGTSVVLPNRTKVSTLSLPLGPALKPSQTSGNISVPVVPQIDDRSEIAALPLNPPTGTRSKAAGLQARDYQPEANSNPYVEGLMADITKLRDKYRTPSYDAQSNSKLVSPLVSPGTRSQTAGSVSLPVGEPMDYIPAERPRHKQAGSNSKQYVDGLRAEIEKLREKYRAEQARQGGKGEANPTPVTTAQSVDLPRRNNPQFNPLRHNQVLQEEMNEMMRAKRRGEQAQRQASPRDGETQVRDRSPRPKTPDQVMATAPIGSDTYQPLVQPSLGQMVSPELPPLQGPDNYLPKNPAIFNGYIWPANGILTSGYGWRWGRMHKGIDIAGPIGTPIYAAAAGVVTYAGWNDGGYGNLVEITHADGSTTIYAHNDRVLVQEGQTVDQGQQVSELGTTGFSTGPHLHFEVHAAGEGAVDPIAYLPQ